MKKIIINLTNKDYDYIAKDIASWYGVKPTLPQLKKILKKQKDVLIGIATQSYLRYGLDTSLREEVIDVFAQALVGKSWPVNATGKRESKRFFKTFIAKAKKAKIEVDAEALIH